VTVGAEIPFLTKADTPLTAINVSQSGSRPLYCLLIATPAPL
jgi:hypothetical protein